MAGSARRCLGADRTDGPSPRVEAPRRLVLCQPRVRPVLRVDEDQSALRITEDRVDADASPCALDGDFGAEENVALSLVSGDREGDAYLAGVDRSDSSDRCAGCAAG